MSDFFENDQNVLSAFQAQYDAQRIAFAPIIFQVTRSLRDMGVLEALNDHSDGLSLEALADATEISTYGLSVLLESGMTAGVVRQEAERWFLTKTGWFVLKDELTNINFDYTHYVNYKALYHLDDSIREERPVGLEAFGAWKTIYPALSSLPEKARRSWFRFDHFYSDSALAAAKEVLLGAAPRSVLEIGANTGKFASALALEDEELEITVFDLPEQIALMQENLAAQGLQGRIRTVAGDILGDTPLAERYDAIWMSQFLDCFAQEEIVAILAKCRDALSANGRILIMEPLWDRQRFETSAFCIINTSPYFTVMANGTSKMYSHAQFRECVETAGLRIEETRDGLGLCQSIIVCRPG